MKYMGEEKEDVRDVMAESAQEECILQG